MTLPGVDMRLPVRCCSVGRAGMRVLALALIATLSIAAADADGRAALERWLEHQQTVTSWRADVEQTRTLKALATPLVATGHVAFARPGQVRWQLGKPPRTLAVGTPDGFSVAYPRLKQVERYPFGESMSPAVQPVLDLLQLGFPDSAQAFHARYELAAASLDAGAWRFDLIPRAAAAQQLLETVHLDIDAANLGLRATEFVFADGSTMRNAFTSGVVDPDLPPDTFELTIESDWQVVQPF